MLLCGWLLLGVGALVANAENQSPLISPNAVEDVAKRTRHSKTYSNADGSFTDVYSISPLHYRDEGGNLRDIEAGPVQKRAAVAVVDTFDTVDYPFKNAWYKPSTSEYDWTEQQTSNCIGWTGLINKRQMFRWPISSLRFSGDITISALWYTFHHAAATSELDITTCLMWDDPDWIDEAEDFYEHECWNHPTNYTTVQTTEDTVYNVNIISHKNSFEWRINQHEDTFFAVGHKLRYEDTSNSSDICASWDSLHVNKGGLLIITYTYSLKKIAPSSSIAVTPNPFNPTTTLSFTLGRPDHVILDVYSVTGQKVAPLVNSYLSAGRHQYAFDGSRLSSGVYFYRLKTSQGVEHGKCLLMK
jgi:hypothetical protein